MKFGPVPPPEAIGAISAHSVRSGALAIRKGRMLTRADVDALMAAGLREIVVARLEDGDVGEDVAALRLADTSAGPNVRVEKPFTGRANIFAAHDGILVVDRARIDAVNDVDESLTIATLAAFKPVVTGEMIATVKVIPYAVAGAVLDAAVAATAGGCATVDVRRYRVSRVGVVSTLTPGHKPATVAKTLRALEARLAPAGARVIAQDTSAHEPGELTAHLRRQADGEAEIIVVFGASAIADRRDVIPAAIDAAGGEIEHFGMPVDPGNLLLVGRIGGKPVIGAPGCARSPKENGFDWVLQRLLAGLAVTRQDVARMGVGGLLMEIGSRGQPRAGGEPTDDP